MDNMNPKTGDKNIRNVNNKSINYHRNNVKQTIYYQKNMNNI